MTPGPGIEPGLRWGEVGALKTALSLFSYTVKIDFPTERQGKCRNNQFMLMPRDQGSMKWVQEFQHLDHGSKQWNYGSEQNELTLP